MTDHDAPGRPDHAPDMLCSAAQPADDLLLTLADQLAAAGYATRSPAWEDRGYLKITNTPGATSELTISTSGHVTWEYRPARPGHLEPVRIAAIITSLLDPGTRPAPPTEPRAHRTLITTTGRALAKHGLHVTLDILDISQAFCDIYSELRINNPARPERGAASLASDGTIWWDTQAQPGHSLDTITVTIIRALADTRAPS
jgi:hypothetical protein